MSLEVRLTITIIFYVWRLEHVECSSLLFSANFAICVVAFIDCFSYVEMCPVLLCVQKCLNGYQTMYVGFTWTIQDVCLLRNISKVYSGCDASILMLLRFCIRFIRQDQGSIPYERELIFSTEARPSEYSLMHLKLGVFCLSVCFLCVFHVAAGNGCYS